MFRLGVRKSAEHRAGATKIMVGDDNADTNGGEQQQEILQHAHPRCASQTAGEDKSSDYGEGNHHCRSAVDCAKACDFNNESQPGELKLNIRNQEDDAH